MVKKNTNPIHVRGLVKSMNVARRNLEEHSRRGLSVTELEAFDNWVKDIVVQTEQICRQYGIKPEQLPTPSYRAYIFLKSLNIPALKPVEKIETGLKTSGEMQREIDAFADKVPSEDFEESNASPKKQVRVANLITMCRHLQTRLAEATSKTERKRKAKHDAIRSLLPEFKETARQVEQICHDEDGSPADLPAPSRRAYQWAKFLSDRENLDMHLTALRWALRAASLGPEDQSTCRKKVPAAIRNLPVQFEFFNLPAIYRMKPGRESIQIIASEGFISATPEGIEALVCMALLRDHGDYQAIVQNYADSEEFSEVLLAMELTIEGSNEAARGRVYDLDVIFQRVNAQYFQGQLDCPRLTWNQTLTHRKFGHYQPASDTIMISITLDDPKIPSYLIEYVMYHELLHKSLGLKITNGRRYAHHKDFLEAEARFLHYAEAKELLSRLANQKLS